jgi:hypothetical protein
MSKTQKEATTKVSSIGPSKLVVKDIKESLQAKGWLVKTQNEFTTKAPSTGYLSAGRVKQNEATTKGL